MNKISITKASPQSLVGGQLNQMALEYMAYSLAGTKDKGIIEKTFNKLWGQNRTDSVTSTLMKPKWVTKRWA